MTFNTQHLGGMAPYGDVHSNHGKERLAIQSTAGGNAGACVCTCVHARTHAHKEQMNPTFLHCEGWDLFSFCLTAMKRWLVRPQIFLPKIKPETFLGREQGSSFPPVKRRAPERANRRV